MGLSRCDCVGLRLLFGLALVLTAWFGITPTPALPTNDGLIDEAAHFATYFGLALLCDRAWPGRRAVLAGGLALFGYGLAIELLQAALPTRAFSLADLAANAAGILAYAALARPLSGVQENP